MESSNPNSDGAVEQKGETSSVIDNSTFITFMTEMRKNMETLSASVSELQNKAVKRRAESDSNPGPSKVRGVSDISSDEDDEQYCDNFDELVNEVQEEDDDFDNDVMLNDLADCFGSDEKCGEPILDKLAKVTNDGVRAVVNADKIKEVSDKYNRPKNVGNLVTPKLNEEIRTNLNRKVRNQDMRLQRTQALVGKAMVPQLQQIDLLLKAKQKGDQPSLKDLTVLAMDGLKMMTYVYCDLSNRRREMIIQPDKNDEYRVLCSSEHPVTDKLFGDDLGKKVEEITKANKVGSKLSGQSRNDRRYQGNRKFQHGQRPQFNSSYKPQPFLGQRVYSQPYRRKQQTFNKQAKK